MSLIGILGARRELAEKSREQIEEETARRWADRAIAAFQMSREVIDRDFARSLARDALDYYNEAVEHAASADRTGDALRAVRAYVDQYLDVDSI